MHPNDLGRAKGFTGKKLKIWDVKIWDFLDNFSLNFLSLKLWAFHVVSTFGIVFGQKGLGYGLHGRGLLNKAIDDGGNVLNALPTAALAVR